MLIRRAAPEESTIAADVYIASRAGAGALIPPSVHDDDDVRRWMRDEFFPRAEVWFAVEDQLPLGILSLEGSDWLEQLYVLPQAQGRGVGTALIHHAKELRPRGLQLWAFQSNTVGRTFYENRGFAAVERTNGEGNEERAPDIRYQWLPEIRTTGPLPGR